MGEIQGAIKRVRTRKKQKRFGGGLSVRVVLKCSGHQTRTRTGQSPILLKSKRRLNTVWQKKPQEEKYPGK